MASDSSGALSNTVPSVSRLVMKLVLTLAPLAYVMEVWQTMWLTSMRCFLLLRHVSVGANRKNGTSRVW